MNDRIPVREVMIGLLMLVASASPAWPQAVEKELEAARTRIAAARDASLDCIAPRSFSKAAERLESAESSYQKGGRIEDIRKQLAKVKEDLAKCEQLEEMGNVILRDALVARADARTHRAPELAPALWEEAEETMFGAGRKVEEGDQNGARREAENATEGYRTAEYEAIRRDVLAYVWKLQGQAREQKAHERAPATLASAEQRLATAETSIKNNRYARDRAESLARDAADTYQHALNISAQVEKMERDRKSAPETVIRGYESELVKVAEALGVEVNFAKGTAAVTNQMVAETERMERDRAELERRIAGLEAEIAGLETDMDSAKSRLATLSDRDALLQKREHHEMKMQEVRAVFKTDEADVLLRGDQMIIRLYGLSFPVGSAEIRPDNFALLSKIRRVLAEFPQSAIAIEGHTDSQGTADHNRVLSQSRADAVREYLLANTSIDAERVAAVGHGEDRPIANNETEDGRAKNRRIDLTLNLSAS